MTWEIWRLPYQICPRSPWGQHPAQKFPQESKPKFHLPPFFYFGHVKLPRPEHACSRFHVLQPALSTSPEVTAPPGAEGRVKRPRASPSSLLWEMRHTKETAF